MLNPSEYFNEMQSIDVMNRDGIWYQFIEQNANESVTVNHWEYIKHLCYVFGTIHSLNIDKRAKYRNI